MRYDEHDEQSSNVEDRRGQGGGGMFRFPGFPSGGQRRRMRIPFPSGGRGLRRGGGISIFWLIVMGVVLWMLGINPLPFLLGNGVPNMGNMPRMPQYDRQANSGGGQSGRNVAPRSDDALAVFSKRVLRDTEIIWTAQFKQFGKTYKPPVLVLYSGSTSTGCGYGQSAMGPFYCPRDQKIYVDLNFFQELQHKFRAPGDFAQAYVIAHEVGHHVQTLLGISRKVQQLKQRASKIGANQIQVRMELQADCFSGVWASKLKNRLEPGDIREGLNAASAIGDDMIQRRTTGRVVPDAFTHGSSEQRVRWFQRGYQNGDVRACDTFKADRL